MMTCRDDLWNTFLYHDSWLKKKKVLKDFCGITISHFLSRSFHLQFHGGSTHLRLPWRPIQQEGHSELRHFLLVGCDTSELFYHQRGKRCCSWLQKWECLRRSTALHQTFIQVHFELLSSIAAFHWFFSSTSVCEINAIHLMQHNKNT